MASLLAGIEVNRPEGKDIPEASAVHLKPIGSWGANAYVGLGHAPAGVRLPEAGGDHSIPPPGRKAKLPARPATAAEPEAVSPVDLVPAHEDGAAVGRVARPPDRARSPPPPRSSFVARPEAQEPRTSRAERGVDGRLLNGRRRIASAVVGADHRSQPAARPADRDEAVVHELAGAMGDPRQVKRARLESGEGIARRWRGRASSAREQRRGRRTKDEDEEKRTEASHLLDYGGAAVEGPRSSPMRLWSSRGTTA
jgi:hypothetical protein